MFCLSAKRIRLECKTTRKKVCAEQLLANGSKLLTDEHVFCDKLFYDKFTLSSVRVYAQKFLMISFAY